MWRALRESVAATVRDVLTNWRLWAALSLLLAAGWFVTLRSNRALMAAYAHPQVEVRFLQAKHERKDVQLKRVEVIRYLPGGTTEVTKTEELVDRTETDVLTDSRTVSTPILTPFLAPARLVWVGWSIPERSPAFGASLRLLGPLWVGAWVRPGASWDYGPNLMLTF